MRKNTCEICKESTYLDRHHIVSKSKKGSNHKSNIANICPSCHRKVHALEIVIEGRFMTTLGEQLIWRHNTEPTITGCQPEIHKLVVTPL